MTSSSNGSSKVLGVVILARHGDREGFYQSSSDYTPSGTTITPLGNAQEFLLGQTIRSIYFTPTSPSFISAFSGDANTPIVNNEAKVKIRADAGGEAGVIFNSAVSLLQGLFPPDPNYATTLANGSVVLGPMGGYQTIPIESVEPDNDVSLEGWTSCNTFTDATEAFYNSATFKAKAAEHAEFLDSLPPYLDGRAVTLDNMWNIFDYMNVQSIHNATFANQLPATYLAQARDLANFHEYGVFSSLQLGGIGNIAGQTILPSIIAGFESIVDANDPLKFVYEAISYKPFISLFNMTGVAQMNPQLAGIVEYAAAVALEVRQQEGTEEPVLRLNFKNGTEDDFRTYSFMNSTTDVPLSTFVNYLKPVAFDDLPTWCSKCSNTKDRGCAMLTTVQASQGLPSAQKIDPLGAGFLGAGLALFVCTILITMVALVRRRKSLKRLEVGCNGEFVKA